MFLAVLSVRRMFAVWCELLPQLRGEDGWRCADVSVLVIVLVVLLLLADSLIFFIIGAAYTTGKTVKTLRDRGWTMIPPKDQEEYRCRENDL